MIRKVLIANRGEIAIRICHTLREMGIPTVGIFTESDQSALHMSSVDDAREISSYLDTEAIIRTAREAGADALHPGYGFLSENAGFAAACEQAGIILIGPRSET